MSKRVRPPKSVTAIVVLVLLGLSGCATAEPGPPTSFTTTSPAAPPASVVASAPSDPIVVDSPQIFQRDPTLNDIHAALGYATVAVGLATGIFNPGVAGKQVHETLGYTSAGLALLTMVFGFIAHSGEIGTDPAFSSNTIHAALGAAGGIMMIIAPFLTSGSTAHKVLGELGAASMGVSVAWKLFF